MSVRATKNKESQYERRPHPCPLLGYRTRGTSGPDYYGRRYPLHGPFPRVTPRVVEHSHDHLYLLPCLVVLQGLRVVVVQVVLLFRVTPRPSFGYPVHEPLVSTKETVLVRRFPLVLPHPPLPHRSGDHRPTVRRRRQSVEHLVVWDPVTELRPRSVQELLVLPGRPRGGVPTGMMVSRVHRPSMTVRGTSVLVVVVVFRGILSRTGRGPT